jgi:hypothetical protein
MPRVTIRSSALIFLAALFFAAGCSDTNPNSFTFEGSHPAGWVPSGHRPAAEANLSSCADCHGNDFSGGISGVACANCHLGVSETEVSVHPLTWTIPIVDHGPYVVTEASAPTSCGIAVCHGVDFAGGGVGVSCDQCHNTYPHAAGWADPNEHGVGARNDILDCKFCHATPGTPPVYDGDAVGVNCLDCHGTTATGAPHPANWIAGGTFTHFFSPNVDPPIGDRTGCEECHAPIADDPSCNIAGVCHAGGANLP